MNGSQYILPPPDLPPFLYKSSVSAFKALILWAKREHIKRLKFCADRGYYKEWKRLHEDYSPIRILAEVKGLRKILSVITDDVWNQLDMRERVFINRAYELSSLLRSRRSDD